MRKNYIVLTVILLNFIVVSEVLAQGEVLEPIATGKSKFLGNVWSTSQEVDFTEYWNQVTPENAGKWGSVERTRDQMSWAEMDEAYALARDNGFPFKQHVMIWGSQQPNWLGDLTQEEQLEEIIEWYAAVSERYPDIDIVEVVNEPLHAPPSYKEALGGNGTTGWDWVIKSFELARTYFPNAQLILNDYGILGNNSAISKYLNIVTLLTERDLIDQLGVQGHAFTVNTLTSETITKNLNSLAESGLPLFVTELDIDGSTDQIQLERYEEVFPALWEHPSVEGITLWGWKPGMWRTEQKAYLINSDGSERPALQWLRDYVQGTLPLGVSGNTMVSVYPNPTSGYFSLSTPEVNQVRIFDLKGRLRCDLKNFAGKSDLDLESGIYLFHLYKGNVLLKTERVILR